MAYFVYLIKRFDSKKKTTYYTGYTKQPVKRWNQHKKRGANKGYELLGMRIVGKFDTIKDAMAREKEIKKTYQHYEKELLYLYSFCYFQKDCKHILKINTDYQEKNCINCNLIKDHFIENNYREVI